MYLIKLKKRIYKELPLLIDSKNSLIKEWKMGLNISPTEKYKCPTHI
jgi:hypothetical protein